MRRGRCAVHFVSWYGGAMTAYNAAEPSRQPTERSVLRWLAYYKPIVVEIETDMGERERLVIDQKNTKRWHACYKTMMSLNACTARALDSKDNVLATYVVREKPQAQEERAGELVSHPATTGGVDIAAIVNTVAQAITTSVKEAMSAMADATKQSFTELTNIAKASNERALISERERMRTLDDREKRLEDEEERLEDEREERGAEKEREAKEREAEREENAS